MADFRQERLGRFFEALSSEGEFKSNIPDMDGMAGGVDGVRVVFVYADELKLFPFEDGFENPADALPYEIITDISVQGRDEADFHEKPLL